MVRQFFGKAMFFFGRKYASTFRVDFPASYGHKIYFKFIELTYIHIELGPKGMVLPVGTCCKQEP